MGRPITSFFGHASHATTEPVLRVEGLTSDWLTDVRKIGAENYYPAADL